jgi:hypothetical protein
MSDDTKKIERDELHELFGDTIPLEVVDMLWNEANSHLTVGQMRAKIRQYARQLPLRQTLDNCTKSQYHAREAYNILRSHGEDNPAAEHLSVGISEIGRAIRLVEAVLRAG